MLKKIINNLIKVNSFLSKQEKLTPEEKFILDWSTEAIDNINTLIANHFLNLCESYNEVTTNPKFNNFGEIFKKKEQIIEINNAKGSNNTFSRKEKEKENPRKDEVLAAAFGMANGGIFDNNVAFDEVNISEDICLSEEELMELEGF